MARIGVFLIAAALIAGMVGCGEATPPARYNLTIAVAPNGSGNATDLTNTSPYAAGTVVNIKAVANSGYHFVNWTAPAGTFVNANATPTTFTMPPQNVTVTASFAPKATEIRTWHDLSAIRNDLGGSYLLMNDLDSATIGYLELASATANGGKGWEPIGTPYEGFTGRFNGQGYEIRDLFINRPDEDHVGLFGTANEGGCIEDVGVVNADVTGGVFGVGCLIGASWGTVSNCYATGNVSGDWGVGGLLGSSSGPVSNSCFIGCVAGCGWVGGLAGGGWDVSNSYSVGDVSGNVCVGGLVGYTLGYCTLTNCYSTSNVTGNSTVGGLVGRNHFCAMANSYSIGMVTGEGDTGGLVGLNDSPYGTTSNSFWDIETSDQTTSAGGTGRTVADMKNITTFSGAGWNITAVANPSARDPAYMWNIVDGQTYPFLSWQPIS